MNAARGGTGVALAASRDGRWLHERSVIGRGHESPMDDLRARLGAGQRRVQDFTEPYRPGLAIWERSEELFFISWSGDPAEAEARFAGTRS